jgi:hypothetical protein
MMLIDEIVEGGKEREKNVFGCKGRREGNEMNVKEKGKGPGALVLVMRKKVKNDEERERERDGAGGDGEQRREGRCWGEN